jgi:diguanylate cyclase (GGDEF)-like protein
MIEAPLSPDEPLRIEALRKTHLLDTPLEERFERITRMAQRLLQVPIAAISLVDNDRQWFKSIQGLNISETSRRVAFCGHTVLQNDVFVIPDAREDARFSDNPLVTDAPNIMFYAGCPVKNADGSKIGSVCVIDSKPRDFSHEDLQILRDLAAFAECEVAAASHHSFEQEMASRLDAISRQAQVDSLTRIWNRDSIFRILTTEIARAQRAGRGIGVIMADIDRFKRINDTNGHPAGDAVIRESAKRMLSAIREVDALGRYGGDEFLIALGECNGLEGARTVGERVCQRIGEGPFMTDFGAIPAAMSVGVAYCDDASLVDSSSLIIAADKALYAAKDCGKNRVEAVLIDSQSSDIAPEHAVLSS